MTVDFLEVPNSVALVITDLVFAGAENQVVTLAISLKKRGWRICVVSLLPPEAHFDTLKYHDIDVFHLNMKRKVPDPRALWRFRAILKKWKPDIVHSHMVHANLLARVTRLFVHIPVLVCTAHSVYEGGKFRDFLYRITDPLNDLLTNVSTIGVERYLKIRAAKPGRIEFAPNGVNLETYQPDENLRKRIRSELNSEDKFIWLSAGRLVPEKDFETLLHAWSELTKVRDDCILWIAGQGESLEELRSKANMLDISETVKFLGLRTDMASLLNAMDSFVLSSLWEGTPMVLLESAAIGKTIVATRVGGVPAIIKQGETGLLVDAQNPTALAQAMGQAMELSELERTRIGQAARDLVESQYGIENVTTRWIETYRKYAKIAANRTKRSRGESR